MSEELARFGHHPDPAIDFCVEVEELESIAENARLNLTGYGHEEDRAAFVGRYQKAMEFRVGGDVNAINAKHLLRQIGTRTEARQAPAEAVEAGMTLGDAFDMGRMWQFSLRGQTLEDSRAVGRTLGSHLFEPIRAEIDAAEKELGFNPHTTADEGVTQAVQIISRAFALAPPVAAPVVTPDVVDALRSSLMGTEEAADNWTFAGMSDAFFRWPVVERELRHVLAALAPPVAGVVEDDYAPTEADGFYAIDHGISGEGEIASLSPDAGLADHARSAAYGIERVQELEGLLRGIVDWNIGELDALPTASPFARHLRRVNASIDAALSGGRDERG